MTPRKPLLEAVRERVLLSDGAIGTQLQQAGIEPGGCGEAWNLTRPDKVLEIQRRYAEAGADCLITNTFGGCPFTLRRHGEDQRAYEINKAAAEIARRAIGERGYVLGDVGPFGGFLEPLGETTEAELAKMIKCQVQGLLDGGVDAIIIETQTAVEECLVDLRVARELGAPCVIASFAFDKVVDGYRTMMGIGPLDVTRRLADEGVDIFAANCGTGIDITGYARIVRQYREATDRPIMAQPNAGQPSMVQGRVVYLETAEKMAGHIPELVEAGANIVGGCCGTTPEHIGLFRRELDRLAGKNQ